MKTAMAGCRKNRLTICSFPQAASDFWHFLSELDLLLRPASDSCDECDRVPNGLLATSLIPTSAVRRFAPNRL